MVITPKHVGAVLMSILILLLKQFSCASVGNKTLITKTPSFNTNSKFCFYPCFPVHYKTPIFGFHFTTALLTHNPVMAWKCKCQDIISKNILRVKSENIAQPGIFHRYRLHLYKHVPSNNETLSTTCPHFWVK